MANKKWGLLLVHTHALPPSLGPWQAAGEGQVSSSSSPTTCQGFPFPSPWVLGAVPRPCSPSANQNIGLGPLICILQ